MKLAVFGLAISSSWGNGHATIWRALCRALAARSHYVTFFERDAPYYARHRDLYTLANGELVLYDSWPSVRAHAHQAVRESDVAIVTSYCPDALLVSDLITRHAHCSIFYDLDTGVTLARLERGHAVPYIGARGLADFDVVLSYTGGEALVQLRDVLGARAVAPLYGCVDPTAHTPVAPTDMYHSEICYLATHAEDRHAAVLELFVEPARRLRDRRFLLAGPQYPADFPWLGNIFYIEHVPPALHPFFYCSARFTLNITRRAMAQYGYCPSGRFFEAAAAGVPILTDEWTGLDFFFADDEVVVVRTADDVLRALAMPEEQRLAIAAKAYTRVLAQHTAAHRVMELEKLLQASAASPPVPRT